MFKTQLVKPNGNIEIVVLSDVLSEEYYNAKIKNSLNQGNFSALKVPDYSTFCSYYEIYDLDAEKDKYHYMTRPVLLQDSNGEILPIYFVRDEQIHDARIMIPAVVLETYSDHIRQMWIRSFNISEFGLFLSENTGIINPLIETHNKHKRYFRYFKNCKVKRYTSFEDIVTVCNKHTQEAIDYWHSRGIQPDVCSDQLSLLSILKGWNKKVPMWALEVTQADGTIGVGIFTLVDNQLYWDFSRRGIGTHIGNNILCAGVELARELGCIHLNMGIGFYNWKWNWATHSIKHLGLDFQCDSSLLPLMNTLLSELPEPTLEVANPDRTVA